MVEITFPVGRLVNGHPMVSNTKKDERGNVKMQKDGTTPQINFYSGLAIQKKGETDWRQTEWGQLIQQEALRCFPNGETQSPHFAWKVEDGDSTIPNKKGKIPNQREGWPGHWIVHISNGYPFSCYHWGKYNPYESIQNKDEIKSGDYGIFIVDVVGNNTNGKQQTDGVYINPQCFILYQAGQRIVSANEVNPAEALAGYQPVMPANAQIDSNIPAPPPNQQQQQTPPPPQQQATPGAVGPAPDFVQNAGGAAPPPPQQQAEPRYNYNGTIYTHAQLVASNWTIDQINALPRV